MTSHIIIAGSGGQGIMLLGKVLAEATMRENKHVTWLPSYGAEVRGGTSHCMIIISEEEIGSPYVYKADSLIIMNEPSLEKFKNRVANNGLLILNSSLASGNGNINTRIFKYPFTDIAVKLGNIKVANMVALGCFIAHKKIVDSKSILKAICGIAPSDKKYLIEINKNALREGMKLE